MLDRCRQGSRPCGRSASVCSVWPRLRRGEADTFAVPLESFSIDDSGNRVPAVDEPISI